MGKVGSATILKSLRRARLGRPIYHVHTLTEEGLKEARNSHRASRAIVPGHSYYASQHLQKKLRIPKKTKWIMVTLVREPIARNISAFFQDIEVYVPDFSCQRYSEPGEIERLTEFFFDTIAHDDPLTWFDREAKKVTGIDVYESPFPKAEGYQIYSGETSDLLLIRCEDINQCGCNAIQKFLGIDEFVIHVTNVSSDKKYGELYGNLQRAIKLPEEYVNRMYSSKYALHFYDEDELAAFKARWLSQVG